MLRARGALLKLIGDTMAGYFEMEAIERSSEACDAMSVVFRTIVNCVDKPDVAATTFDKFLGNATAETLVVPDADQFDLLRDALRALDTGHLRPLAELTADGPPLLRLICYRSGRADEPATSDDELAVEYFNPRPDSDGLIHHTDSAVRLTHRPTGTTTVSDGARSRHRNLAQAREMLSAKLADNFTPLLLNDRSIRAFQQRVNSRPAR